MLQRSVRPSIVCNVCVVAKQCVLPKKTCLKKQIVNSLWGIEWSRDRCRYMTQKGQGRDPNVLRAQYLEKKLEMLFSNNRQLLDTCSLL